jgi:hypothetical protein
MCFLGRSVGRSASALARCGSVAGGKHFIIGVLETELNSRLEICKVHCASPLSLRLE